MAQSGHTDDGTKLKRGVDIRVPSFQRIASTFMSSLSLFPTMQPYLSLLSNVPLYNCKLLLYICMCVHLSTNIFSFFQLYLQQIKTVFLYLCSWERSYFHFSKRLFVLRSLIICAFIFELSWTGFTLHLSIWFNYRDVCLPFLSICAFVQQHVYRFRHFVRLVWSQSIKPFKSCRTRAHSFHQNFAKMDDFLSLNVLIRWD